MSHHTLVGNPNTITLTNADLLKLKALFPDNRDLRYAHLPFNLDSCEVPVIPKLDTEILRAVENEAALKEMGLRKGPIDGRLEMANWHGEDDDVCGTMHCRAGWAEFLGGKAAQKLKGIFKSPGIVGSLIYFVSSGYVPNFYEDDVKALEDLREKSRSELSEEKTFNFREYMDQSA